MVVTILPSNVVILGVSSGVCHHAFSRELLDIGDMSTIGEYSLVHGLTSCHWSDAGPVVVPVPAIGRDSVTSLVERPNGSGSSVEGEPLSSVLWVPLMDSKSESVSTDVFSVEHSLSTSHARSDLELNSIIEWLSWVYELSLVSSPSLVLASVTVVPNNNLVMTVASSMKTFSTVVSDSLSS